MPSKEPSQGIRIDQRLPLKRQREDILQATTASTIDSPHLPSLDKIDHIRLEAIFHPKFENEARDSQIRQEMKERVANDEGYLEVSVKHSGSLLLWSGGQRYYSKNSSDNVFTHVGEILLRQHFVRAFWGQEGTIDTTANAKDPTATATGPEERFYRECSQYVEESRLTLAFEVVTAVLGDHGDRPHRDFLILTAVADRATQKFYSTQQVVQLAQKFRLPHNDFWIFSSPTSVEALFEFYDTSRETGTAGFVVETLTKSAEILVPSLYPHVDFQGDILEGIVIRYVHSKSNIKDPGDSIDEASMFELAEGGSSLCSLVPSSLPDCFELVATSRNTRDFADCLSVDLRKVFSDCRQQSQKPGSDEEDDAFANCVANLLGRSYRRKAVRLPRNEATNVPELLRKLTNSPDQETRRIANLVERLDELKVRVDYCVFREEILDRSYYRWLCIVHVRNDFSHQKYRKDMKPGDMALFRGFALELSDGTGFSANKPSKVNPMEEDFMEVFPSASSSLSIEEPALMLKMKFLPYMVRTFGCRNGLRSLKQAGVPGFMKYCYGLLSKWNMSEEAKQKWMPFFRAWATYAEPRLSTRLQEDGDTTPQLSSACYLDHLHRFLPLYESGEFGSFDWWCLFEGFVVVVSPAEDLANTAADFIAEKVSASQRYSGTHSVPSGTVGGVVCSVAINDNSGRFRKLLQEHDGPSFGIFIGCSDEDIERVCMREDEDEMNMKGKLNGWRKLDFSHSIDLSGSVINTVNENCGKNNKDKEIYSEEMRKCIALLLEKGSEEDGELSPGLLVFFPQIPGCGKSSLVNLTFEREFQDFLIGRSNPERKLHVRMGDKTREKFWPLVKKEKKRNRTSVYIADKNVPASSWDLIANVCAVTGAVGVPVIPLNGIKTTVVHGTRFPDGAVMMGRTHTFPFSLHYLAVCLLRVISRKPGTHPGKLDYSQDRACMIVVMFYCLFEKVSAEDFLSELSWNFEGNNAFIARAPIEIPFFKEDSSELPAILKDILVEAIRAQRGYNIKRKDVGKLKDPYLDDLESRLRKSLEDHRNFLTSMTVTVEESQRAFFEKLKDVVELADRDEVSAPISDEAGIYTEKRIKYVAVEVSPDDVHTFLVAQSDNATLESFWDVVANKKPPSEILLGKQCTDKKFVRETHVTMAHSSETPQESMHEMFGPILNQTVDVEISALLWDENTAALEVTVASHTKKDQPIQPSKNPFTHITLWTQEGSQAFRSNELPDLVHDCKAQRVVFDRAITLSGRLVFRY